MATVACSVGQTVARSLAVALSATLAALGLTAGPGAGGTTTGAASPTVAADVGAASPTVAADVGAGAATPLVTATAATAGARVPAATAASRPFNMVPVVSYQPDPAGARARNRGLVAYVSGLAHVLRQPLQTSTNYVTESVCSPPNAAYCANFLHTGADIGGPGRALTVSSYTFGTARQAFGNGLLMMYVPSSANRLALYFDYSEDGGDIGGNGFDMEFIYLTPALLAQITNVMPVDYFSSQPSSLLSENEFEISDSPEYETTTGEMIGIGPDAKTVIAAFDGFTGSAQRFRAHALARQAQLLAEVEAQVGAGHVSRPVHCRYPPNGAAPLCQYGPLTSAKKAKEIATAEKSIGQADGLVDRYYRSMYALLSSSIALTACPACWSGT